MTMLSNNYLCFQRWYFDVFYVDFASIRKDPNFVSCTTKVVLFHNFIIHVLWSAMLQDNHWWLFVMFEWIPDYYQVVVCWFCKHCEISQCWELYSENCSILWFHLWRNKTHGEFYDSAHHLVMHLFWQEDVLWSCFQTVTSVSKDSILMVFYDLQCYKTST